MKTLYIINHSGGKDSQAMTNKLAATLPADAEVAIIHSILPEADWDGIPQHIHATVPLKWKDKIHYVQAGKTFFDMVERRFESRPEVPSFPSPSTRQCTSDLKRDPIAKLTRKLSRELGITNIVHCVGIRREESSQRAKRQEWEENKRESKAGRTVRTWHPILEMTEVQVFANIKLNGQVPHPMYQAGMTRLSCRFCIMASEKDLRTAARIDPVTAERIIELEEKTGWTMSPSRKPLAEIVA